MRLSLGSVLVFLAASALASISTPYVSDGRVIVAPGTYYDRGTFTTTTSGRQAAYILEIDASQPVISFEASLSNDRISGLETTTAQANRKNAEGHRAVGGVNSDFWDTVSTSAPNGIHIQNGELMSDGGAARPTFGVTASRQVLMALVDVNTTVTRADGVTRVARKVNQPRASGDLVIYTPRFGASTGTTTGGTEVVVSGVTGPLTANGTFTGSVSLVRPNLGNTPIGSNEIVLSALGTAATAFLNALVPGQTITFSSAVTAGWESVMHAGGGGQWIVRNGAVDVDPDSPGFADVTHPRSAIGLTSSGNVVIAVVDGRQPGYSIGVRLDELGELMISRGCVVAANFDGGGSSTLAVRLPGDDGVTQVNSGSDGFERSVSNSILVFSSAPTGPLAIANVLPSNALLFMGSALDYMVKGQDAAYNKVAVDPATVSWSLSNSSVGSIGGNGRFTSTSAGATDVRAAVGTVTGSTPATVVNVLSALEVRPNPAVVPPNGTQLFNLTGRDGAGRAVIVDNNVATWNASGPIGTIDSAGLLTASPSGSGSVHAAADGASGSATVDVGRPPVILEDFEDISDMRVQTALATATLTTAARPNPVRSGTYSGRLSYSFVTTPPNSGTSAAYAQHPSPAYRPISDRPLRIGVWVYGDGSRHWLRGNYRDGNNTQRTIDFTAAPTPAPITAADCRKRTRGIDWVGWKYVEAALPQDGSIPLPLKWERIYVVETANICDDASSLYFDDLRAVYSNTSEDLTGPEVRDVFPAAGKRVFTSQPQIGGTVVDNTGGSGVAPESIRLTVDNAQVAATFDPTTGVVRYTPAQPLADGTHTVRLEADDRAGNPALPFGEWSFIVYTGPDLDAPVVDRAQPLTGTTSRAGRPRVSARIQDEYRGVDPSRIELTIDGTAVPAVWDSAAGVVWYSPAAPLSNGTHSVTLRAGDREATPNYATASWSFQVNAIPQPSGPFRFTWIADGGYFNGTSETSATAILGEHLKREKEARPDLLIFGGDIVENDQQVNYDRAVAALNSTGAPYLVAAGNHEISGSLSRDRFWRTFGPTIAAVDYGPVDFLIVDVAASSLAFDTSQYAWIESELARSDAQTVYVVLHVPTRDPFGSSHGLPASEGTRLDSIFAAANRNIVVLSGDAHAYARWNSGKVQYFISGGGGGGLDAIPEQGGFYHRLHLSSDGRVDVVPLLESILMSAASVSLNGGDTGALSATGDFFTSTAANIVLPVADPFARTWTSSDVAVVEVNDGALQAWTPGNATITLASGGATATAQVTVTATLASLKRLLLMARAANGVDSDGVYQSLLAKLDAAENDAPGGLRAFINELRAQEGQHVTSLWTARLIANAEYVFRAR